MAETLDSTVTTDLSYDLGWWRKRPDAKDDWAKTDEDTPVTIDVLHNDVRALGVIKVDGKPITEDTTVALKSGATVDLDGGKLTYDPGEAFQYLDSGENGSDTFTYTVAGYRGGEDTASVHVAIAGVTDEPGSNHAPVANNDYAILPYHYPYPGPVPLPYAEGADATNGADASLSDAPIFTTLALGEEGDPNPYPSSVKINVLANDTDADGDELAVAQINGTDVKIGESVTLKSGAEVTLNEDGSLTYSEGIIVYADTDPRPLTEQAVTLAGSELMPIDPILPPEPLPYPGPLLADSFSYTATDDEGAESNAATVTVYRGFYDYILGAEPVADASTTAAPAEPNDLLLA
jgi:Bacterial cadherin-like domain/Bacterial Ig domain